MSEITCDNCGGSVLHKAGTTTPASGVLCSGCSAQTLAATIGEPTASSSSVLTALAESVGAGSRGQLDPYSTGTIVLEPVLPAEALPSVEVKVKGYLTVEGAPPDEADHRLRGASTVVGRVEGDLVVPDTAISTRHFQIEENGSEFVLRDLGSSNGTFLNGRMVRSAPLQSGDRIEAGSTVFIFSVRHAIPM